MPVKVRKTPSGKWQIVESGGGVARGKTGAPVKKGGGHKTKAAAMRQARAINANLKK